MASILFFYLASACIACIWRYCFNNFLCLSVRHIVALYLNKWTYLETFWLSGRGMTSVFFYHATLCVSAVFVVARCPSVCHVGVLYAHGWRYRQTSFFWPTSPVILVFDPPAPIPNSKGNPFTGGRRIYGCWEKLAIFDWNRRLFRKRYEIGPWLPWNVNRKS